MLILHQFFRVFCQSQGASLKCPPSGPPNEFFDRFGTSRDCSACKSMDNRGTRSGLSHSKKCCDRYERWLRIQISGDYGIDPASIETLEPELDQSVFGDESPSDLGVGLGRRLRRSVKFSDETETGNVPNETETANVRSWDSSLVRIQTLFLQRKKFWVTKISSLVFSNLLRNLQSVKHLCLFKST